MEMIDRKRASTPYSHEVCSDKYLSARKEVCMTNRHCDANKIMQFTFLWIKGADDRGPLMGIGNYAIQFVCILFRRDWQGLRESCSRLCGHLSQHTASWNGFLPEPLRSCSWARHSNTTQGEYCSYLAARKSSSTILHQFQTQSPMLLTVKVCYSLRIGLVVVRNNPSVQLNHISACRHNCNPHSQLPSGSCNQWGWRGGRNSNSM